MSSSKKVSRDVKALLQRRENANCADCDSKFIKQADVKFAVFLCRECGEGHVKKLGNLTKIVETTDRWQSDWLALFQSVGGNTRINQEQYESNIHNYDGRKRPTCSTRFIYDKYKFRFFGGNKEWMPTISASRPQQEAPVEKVKKAKKAKKAKAQAAPRAVQVTSTQGDDDWDPFVSTPTSAVASPAANTGGFDFGPMTSAPSNNNNDFGDFGSFTAAPVQQAPVQQQPFVPAPVSVQQQFAPQQSFSPQAMQQTTQQMGNMNLFGDFGAPQASPQAAPAPNIDIFFGGAAPAKAAANGGSGRKLDANAFSGLASMAGDTGMPQARPMSRGPLQMGGSMNRPMGGGMNRSAMGMSPQNRNMGMGMNRGMGMNNNMGMGGMGMNRGMGMGNNNRGMNNMGMGMGMSQPPRQNNNNNAFKGLGF